MNDETQAPPPASPEEDVLVEALAGAYRDRDPRGRGLRFHPAFYDLDEDGRARAHALALQSRTLEAALDPQGLSSTTHAVLARILAAE